MRYEANVPESDYVDACNALGELHSVTELYKVTILEFYVEKCDGVPKVKRRTRTLIMESKEDEDDDPYEDGGRRARGSHSRASPPPPGPPARAERGRPGR